MYERMLNKQETPTFANMLRHSGDSGVWWKELDKRLDAHGNIVRQIRFPYGNQYGWSVKYSVKRRHICDIFAERGAFTALFQVSTSAMDTVLNELGAYATQVWAEKSPCAGGGWISYQVTHEDQVADLEKIIGAKISAPKKTTQNER